MNTLTFRRTLSAAAVAACLPYLTLKAAWFSGSTLGLSDPAFAHDPVMKVANAVTFGLDVVAVTLALAFVAAWGRRLPGWLVAAPMWVGSGLLGAVAIVLPIQGALLLAHPEPLSNANSPIQPWVFVMVYTGFMLQGVFLLAGYWCYARDRWPRELTARLGSRPAARLTRLDALALVLAGVALAANAAPVASGTALGVLSVALTAAPVVGGAALVSRRLRRPAGLPTGLATAALYVASGAAASWGTYATLLTTISNPLAGPAGAHASDVPAHVALALCGFALAWAGLVRRASRP